MAQWLEVLKQGLPDYAKDIRLNLDAVILRSTLDPVVAEGCALAAAVATGNGSIVGRIYQGMTDEVQRDAAMAAASLMAQNNIWYPFVEMANDQSLKGLPAQLRMNAIASHGGTTKVRFESYSLCASIVGKCNYCVKAHYDLLKQEGYTIEQLRDIGRVAAVMTAVCKLLVG
jgi:lipoyl-dependent peroxiredoxin subunit D